MSALPGNADLPGTTFLGVRCPRLDPPPETWHEPGTLTPSQPHHPRISFLTPTEGLKLAPNVKLEAHHLNEVEVCDHRLTEFPFSLWGKASPPVVTATGRRFHQGRLQTFK